MTVDVSIKDDHPDFRIGGRAALHAHDEY